MIGAGGEYLKEARTGDPLLATLYADICRDRGEPVWDTAQHKADLLKALLASPLLETKGDKVALRRWFSWARACPGHLEHWHSKLLLLTALGIKLE
eukprot:5552219-Lingulodinium_polyedra.AAC.1